jgi:hypothetical protein
MSATVAESAIHKEQDIMTTKAKNTNSKQITISRNDVLAAIFTEPLQAVSPGWTSAKPSDPECKVCAVGAVMRYIGKTKPKTKLLKASETRFEKVCEMNTYGTDNAYTGRDTSSTNSHLRELSDTYEALSSEGKSLRKIQSKLTDLVIKTFPTTLTVQVRA